MGLGAGVGVGVVGAGVVGVVGRGARLYFLEVPPDKLASSVTVNVVNNVLCII
ncbi:hypothetical protein COO91_00535 [Nostoc flagelliforme CCNUN1]|uniref:Uncharacterized protein n=1 Tax=Nostoc flagelliforme CCNUN1 TaxID=2038116 RepID=A0A2K8SGY5_9NOSO|nr:hypothetical protein COO91_00535 [Nostoc flagelliforme CCNUN1]